jgi:hypothetical protein
MAKKKETIWMPEYMTSKNENEWYAWGVNNNIRISPKPATQGPNPKEWYLEVFNNGRWYKSPNVYGPKEIWYEFYLMYKFYYDKYR